MKARNANSLSARCAWVRVRSGVSVRVGKRGARREGRRMSPFPEKERGLGEKQGEFDRKSTCFASMFSFFDCLETFLS